MRRKVGVGRDFDGEVRVHSEKRRYVNEWTSSVIAIIAAVVIAVLVLGAAALGLAHGSYTELNAVWVVAGPIAGAIIGRYFGGSRKVEE